MKVDLFSSLEGLERVLDHQLERHGVLASNLANAETPGFRPRDLVADPPGMTASLPLETSEARHISGSADESTTSQIVELPPTRADANGVELERVMAELSANRLRYETALEVVRRRMALLRYAAVDGGG
jgi:flagellar basal-body rod protein FlgB